MERSEAMLKSAVIGTGINKICKAQLLDVPEALKPGMLNNIKNNVARYTDKSIYRIVYDLALIDFVGHLENS
jgi:hypothetical protein